MNSSALHGTCHLSTLFRANWWHKCYHCPKLHQFCKKTLASSVCCLLVLSAPVEQPRSYVKTLPRRAALRHPAAGGLPGLGLAKRTPEWRESAWNSFGCPTRKLNFTVQKESNTNWICGKALQPGLVVFRSMCKVSSRDRQAKQ